MAQGDAAIHKLLGPRARPSFLIRFGIWFVVAILAVTALVGSLISYGDRTELPVQFTKALPLRSEGGGGRIHFNVADGALIEKNQIIARLEPGPPGVTVAVVRIPAEFSANVKAGDPLVCEIRDAHGLRRRTARVDSVLAAGGQGVVVRVALAGEPANGVLTIAGAEHSVLYRLAASLLKK